MTLRSNAYQRLGVLLGEVDLVLEMLPKRARGRPCKSTQDDINSKRDALCKAALIMLSAALEAYCEDLCKESNGHLKEHVGGLDNEDYKFVDHAIQRSHGANNYHIINLFGLIGIPWITYENIGWQKKSSKDIRQELRSLAVARNKVSHGANVSISEAKVLYWREFVFRLADRLEFVTGVHLARITKTPPPWG
jgi:hypothetical protein